MEGCTRCLTLFVLWTKAIRIVALVQISSTFVDRVYSQAKLICESRGDTILRDNYEMGLMAHVKKKRLFAGVGRALLMLSIVSPGQLLWGLLHVYLFL